MAITLYSSGPIEADSSGIIVGIVKVVNLAADAVDVRVRLFNLNGIRDLIFEDNFSVGSFSSGNTPFSVPEVTDEYEVTVRLDTPGNVDDVLISYWGKDASNNIIASQRLVHEEFHRLSFTFESLEQN
jgi:hypothetical protein